MLPFYSSRLFKLQNAGLPSEITQCGAAMTPFFSVRVYLCVKRGNEAKWKQSVAWNRCQKLEHRGFFSFDHIFATGGFFWSHSQRICLSETPLNKRKKTIHILISSRRREWICLPSFRIFNWFVIQQQGHISTTCLCKFAVSCAAATGFLSVAYTQLTCVNNIQSIYWCMWAFVIQQMLNTVGR